MDEEELGIYQQHIENVYGRAASLDWEFASQRQQQGFGYYMLSNFGNNYSQFTDDQFESALVQYEDDPDILPEDLLGLRSKLTFDKEEYGYDESDKAGLDSSFDNSIWSDASIFRRPAVYDQYGEVERYLDTGYSQDAQGNWPEQAFGYLRGYGARDENGVFRGEYMTWQAQMGSEARDYYGERWNAIQNSRKDIPYIRHTGDKETEQAMENYQPSLGIPITGQARTITFKRTYASGKESMQTRYRQGSKFVSADGQLTQEQLQEIGRDVRGMLLENYQALIGAGHGSELTGQLKAAVEQSSIEVNVNPQGETVVLVTLADLPGVPRPSDSDHSHPRPSTGQYGAWVFYGRAGITAEGKEFRAEAGTQMRTFMRFMIHGKMITTMSVLPSKPYNVFELTPEQTSRLADKVADLSGSDIAKAIADALRPASEPAPI